MASISRVNGTPAGGEFYGYQFIVVKVANSNNVFTADAVDGTTKVITEGGYSQGVRAAQQIGSMVALGGQANAGFCAIFDQATLNNGPGATTSGAFGALKDAFVSEIGGSAGDYTITTSTALNAAGTFTFA